MQNASENASQNNIPTWELTKKMVEKMNKKNGNASEIIQHKSKKMKKKKKIVQKKKK